MRFLNAQWISVGIISEEHWFCNQLVLAQWVRDARKWAENLIVKEPYTFSALQNEVGEAAIQRCRTFLEEFGIDMTKSDPIEITLALMKWANQMRGFAVSQYSAQMWEFVVYMVDAAMWIGWISPHVREDRPDDYAHARAA